MKKLGQILLVIGLAMLTYQIRTMVVANYRFERDYLSFWHLADKSSSIPAKQKHIEQFVAALEKGRTNGAFAEYNALWLKTPDNNFNFNLEAVKTLSARLSEIQEMKPSSFEYNTAIQQITAQEQGEAKAMLGIFKECYLLKGYFLIWGWVEIVAFFTWLILIFIGAIMWEAFKWD